MHRLIPKDRERARQIRSKSSAVLVFPPFSAFSYIPLGIAYLKSFIELNMGSVAIENIDLNNAFFHRVDRDKKLIKTFTALCGVCANRDSTERCNALFKASALFSNRLKTNLRIKGMLLNERSKVFYDFARYTGLLKKMDGFYEQMRECIESQCISFLRQDGHRASRNLIDEILGVDVARIMKSKPILVGFSIFAKEQMLYSVALAKVIKRKHEVPIVFGGPYPSLIDSVDILKCFDFIDFVIRKEGELGLWGLLRYLRDAGRIEQIPNLIYRRQGSVVCNEEQAISDLNQLPAPDFSNFDINDYFSPEKVISTHVSRGCYWRKCTFCVCHNTFSGRYRIKSVNAIIGEIERYSREGIKYIFFADEIISASYMHLISEALRKNRIKIFFAFLAKPTRDFTYRILKNMYASGCRLVFWGVESGSPGVLGLIDKGTNIEDIEAVLKNSRKAGLRSIIGIITNYPSQGMDNVMENLKFMTRAKHWVDCFSINRFSLLKGSIVSKNPERFRINNLRERILLEINNRPLRDNSLDYDYERGRHLKDLEAKLLNKCNFKTISFLNKKYFEHLLIQVTKNRDLLRK